jgi:uncharacterized glyoxalase superfamily protein PhnB
LGQTIKALKRFRNLRREPPAQKLFSIEWENSLAAHGGQKMARLSRIAPELPVADLNKSIEYYRHSLGFQLVAQMPAGDYAIVERDDVAIHLFKNDAHRCSPVGIHIFTEDLDALHAELQQRGARVSQGVLRKPWGNRDFRVTDDSGNEIKFTEPLQHDDE